ncbi:MAG: hypothetical protein RI931_112 [Actinomycetota bacterium]
MKKMLLMVSVALSLGLSSLFIQSAASTPIALDEAVAEFQSREASFEVIGQPVKFGFANNYSVAIKLLSLDDEMVRARGQLSGPREISEFVAGEIYVANLKFSPARKATRQGFEASIGSGLEQIKSATSLPALASALRKSYLLEAGGVSQNSIGLVAGLAIGDTSLIDGELLEQMRTVSLTHLTAVSGANCAIIIGMVYLLVSRLRASRWLRTALSLAALIGYVAIVGTQPSVLRAAFMSSVVLLAISLGRRATAGSALGLAILILLIADPWLATDFGFALSAAATAGILLLAPEIYLRLKTRVPNWLALGLSVTISAQLLCLPVLLQLQSGLSTYSVLANLLAEPLVAPVTILGILACLVAWFAPWLAFGLSWVASLATWWIALVAEQLAAFPMTTISWATGWLGATLAVVVIVATLLWLRAEAAGMKATGALTLIAVLSITIGSSGASIAKSASWPPRDWLVVACDVGQGDALVVRSENQVAVIDVGKDRKLIDGCLTQLGIRRIDLLVLTHFDLDHIGGLAGALQGREVGQALISPFNDDRWGASLSKQAIEQFGAVSSFGQVGVRGSLGQFSWRVLSPEPNAAGAEDSNDASIVILWQSPQLNLLTMADLGERGQMRVAGSSDSWLGQGLDSVPMVLKVSHHGSADQYPELIEALGPDLALVSVGADNSYGHPTLRTIGLLEKLGTRIFRTDLSGDLAVSISDGVLGVSVSGHG